MEAVEGWRLLIWMEAVEGVKAVEAMEMDMSGRRCVQIKLMPSVKSRNENPYINRTCMSTCVPTLLQ